MGVTVIEIKVQILVAFKREKQEDLMSCWNEEERVEIEEQRRKMITVEGL